MVYCLAQRRHVTHLLGNTFSILSVLSHLSSPSLWILFCRNAFRFQFESSTEWTLHFAYGFIFLTNSVPIISHIITGPITTGAMLDFIGLSYTPSALCLCILDILIAVLHLVQVYILFEISLQDSNDGNESFDLLLPPDILGDRLTLVLEVKLDSIWNRLFHSPVPSHFNTQQTETSDISLDPLALVDDRLRLFPHAHSDTNNRRQPAERPSNRGQSTPGGLDTLA